MAWFKVKWNAYGVIKEAAICTYGYVGDIVNKLNMLQPAPTSDADILSIERIGDPNEQKQVVH